MKKTLHYLTFFYSTILAISLLGFVIDFFENILYFSYYSIGGFFITISHLILLFSNKELKSNILYQEVLKLSILVVFLTTFLSSCGIGLGLLVGSLYIFKLSCIILVLNIPGMLYHMYLID